MCESVIFSDIIEPLGLGTPVVQYCRHLHADFFVFHLKKAQVLVDVTFRRLLWYLPTSCHHPCGSEFLMETELITFLMPTGNVPFEVSASPLPGHFAHHSFFIGCFSRYFTHNFRDSLQGFVKVFYRSRLWITVIQYRSDRNAKIVLFTSFDTWRFVKTVTNWKNVAKFAYDRYQRESIWILGKKSTTRS